MSAGTGVLHSEHNPSRERPAHLLQIWILPERRGLAPGYEQRAFPVEERRGRLRLVASRDGRDGSITVHQNAEVYAGLLDPGRRAVHALRPGRHAWVHLARGAASLGGHRLAAGDGAAVSGEPSIALEGVEEAEILVFDLP
jgi:redox-sensitive bicupin YhaK (pirin superfamily)